MPEIADDFPDRADALDYEPDIDDPIPYREADELHDAQMSRYADEEAEAYASLPAWRRWLVDWRTWRSERRHLRRIQRRARGFDADAPF